METSSRILATASLPTQSCIISKTASAPSDSHAAPQHAFVDRRRRGNRLERSPFHERRCKRTDALRTFADAADDAEGSRTCTPNSSAQLESRSRTESAQPDLRLGQKQTPRAGKAAAHTLTPSPSAAASTHRRHGGVGCRRPSLTSQGGLIPGPPPTLGPALLTLLVHVRVCEPSERLLLRQKRRNTSF